MFLFYSVQPLGKVFLCRKAEVSLCKQQAGADVGTDARYCPEPPLCSTQEQLREAETHSSEHNLFGGRCEVRTEGRACVAHVQVAFPVSHLVKIERLQLLLTAMKTKPELISGFGIKSP